MATYTFQGKKAHKIYTLDASQKKFKNFLNYYCISRTPTTLILDKLGRSQVALVGATFQDV
jgi:hypothetical protein